MSTLRNKLLDLKRRLNDANDVIDQCIDELDKEPQITPAVEDILNEVLDAAQKIGHIKHLEQGEHIEIKAKIPKINLEKESVEQVEHIKEKEEINVKTEDAPTIDTEEIPLDENFDPIEEDKPKSLVEDTFDSVEKETEPVFEEKESEKNNPLNIKSTQSKLKDKKNAQLAALNISNKDMDREKKLNNALSSISKDSFESIDDTNPFLDPLEEKAPDNIIDPLEEKQKSTINENDAPEVENIFPDTEEEILEKPEEKIPETSAPTMPPISSQSKEVLSAIINIVPQVKPEFIGRVCTILVYKRDSASLFDYNLLNLAKELNAKQEVISIILTLLSARRITSVEKEGNTMFLTNANWEIVEEIARLGK